MIRHDLRLAVLATILLALACGSVPAAPAPPPGTTIASDGFGRPERLDVVSAGSDLRVAIAGGAGGPVPVWEDEGGLSWWPANEVEPVRLVASRGVRDLDAGEAGGEPVVAWSERDLADGRTRFSWRWRNETRTLFETGQRPLIRFVAGGERPELLVATPDAEGWRLSLHAWDGRVREASPRPLTVAGLDALRRGEHVHVAWLEGTDEVALGKVERDWAAYLARWRDGEPRPGPVATLGEALRRGSGDAVRLAWSSGEVHAAWTGPDGRIRATGPGGERELGAGTPLGRLDGAWTWSRGAEVRRSATGADDARTVLRLPAAPERIVAAEHDGVMAVAWSSGRYLGGLEVWAVTDRTAYRASAVERVASLMGWDPWRPWSAAGGHLLLSLLAAVLGAAVLTPVWWAATSLLARRHAVPSGVAALEGAAVATGSLLAVLAFVAVRATVDDVTTRALLGGPGWIAASTVTGFALSWVVLRGADAEPSFTRLVAAWIAGGSMLFVLAFGTLQAWQILFGAVA